MLKAQPHLGLGGKPWASSSAAQGAPLAAQHHQTPANPSISPSTLGWKRQRKAEYPDLEGPTRIIDKKVGKRLLPVPGMLESWARAHPQQHRTHSWL